MIEKLKGRNLFLILGILTVVMGIFIRTIMLKNPGFFEPDNFFYYSVLRQAVQNGFVVPTHSYLSGFPTHNHIGEAPGIIYMSAIPYFFLQYMGVSYYTVMRWIPILFGLLTMIGVYLLSRTLSKSRMLALLALFLTAVSIGSLSRTSGTQYRGDTFISVFLLAALILLLKGLEDTEKQGKMSYYLIVISGFVLSLGSIVWNGYPYTFVVYLMATAFISVYAFISDRTRLLSMNIVAVLSLLLAYLLQHAYALVHLSNTDLPLTGLDFFVLYMPVLIGTLAAYYMIMNKRRFPPLDNRTNRTFIIIIGLALTAMVLASQFSYYSYILYGKQAIGQTTLELQPTTLSFLIRIFNVQILLLPLGLIFFLLFANHVEDHEEHHRHGKLNFNITPAFLAILSYVVVAGILQGAVVRFNAVFSVPLAIFAAYGLFLPGAFLKKHTEEIQDSKLLRIAVAAILVILLLAALYVVGPAQILNSYFQVGMASRILAVLIVVFGIAYVAYRFVIRKKFELVAYACFVAALLVYMFYTGYIASYTSNPADGVGTQFLSAMQWMRNNTPANATVAAVWTDGSVVEGWANRTSYIDSVGGEKLTKIEPFNKWLFNTSNDPSFLYSIDKPNYLVSRVFWYAELQGLLIEANITNTTPYTYATLTNLNRTVINDTVYYRFSSGNDTVGGYRAELLVAPGANGTTRFAAFIGTTASDTLVLIKNVIFYNTQNYNYSIAMSNVTNSLNETLLVTYKNNNIVGGTIVGSELAKSNFFKFTVLCNTYICPADTSNVTYKAVYINNDTRIFKINYR